MCNGYWALLAGRQVSLISLGPETSITSCELALLVGALGRAGGGRSVFFHYLQRFRARRERRIPYGTLVNARISAQVLPASPTLPAATYRNFSSSLARRFVFLESAFGSSELLSMEIWKYGNIFSVQLQLLLPYYKNCSGSFSAPAPHLLLLLFSASAFLCPLPPLCHYSWPFFTFFPARFSVYLSLLYPRCECRLMRTMAVSAPALC